MIRRMDFDDTPEEAACRARARAWLEANAIPKGSPEDFSAGYFSGDVDPSDYVKRCRWWQGQFRTRAGSPASPGRRRSAARAPSAIEAAVFTEEQAKWGVSVGTFAVAHGMVGPTLMQHGTPEQQARWLGPMLQGEEVWCQLFSEPEGRVRPRLAAHPSGPRRRRVGGRRSARCGRPTPSTASGACSSPAPASGRGAPKHEGITYFAVDMRSPGIDIRGLRQINGDAHFNEVFLDGVRIPASQVIGEVGKGWKVAVTTLSNERVAIAGRFRHERPRGGCGGWPMRSASATTRCSARPSPGCTSRTSCCGS